jgi:hypothetical protein
MSEPHPPDMADPAQLATLDGLRVRVQLLDAHGERRDSAAWPVEESEVYLAGVARGGALTQGAAGLVKKASACL